MARLKKKKTAQGAKKAEPRSLVPWRGREASVWWPFPGVEEWYRNIDDLFSRFLVPKRFEGTAFGELPAMESFTKQGNHVIRMDLPGVDAKEIDISVGGNVLTVKGERKHKEEVKRRDYARREIAYGSFERATTLPEGVDTDKIQASFDKGVLEITMPATTQAASSKRIAVEAKK